MNVQKICCLLAILLGFSLPSVSAQLNLSADCVSGTANLSAITAANQPLNTTLTWHNATPVSSTNEETNTSGLNPGTYYAAFYHAGDDCYSSNVLTVTITAACCLDNICPATTVDLTYAVSSNNTPAGAVVSYHTAIPATTANEIADPSAVGPGNYFLSFKDEANNCYAADGMGATEVIVNPITTCDPLTNICPATMVDLTTAYSVGNMPAGTSTTWHTAQPADGNNLLSDATMISTSGTYYAAFYDSTNDCYSDNSSPVVVTISPCLAITALDDDFSSTPIDETAGGTTASVFPDNGSGPDDAAGSPATDALIDDNISITNDGGLTGVTINTDGTINVPPGTTAGTYNVEYQICLTTDNTACDVAIATIVVNPCPITKTELTILKN